MASAMTGLLGGTVLGQAKGMRDSIKDDRKAARRQRNKPTAPVPDDEQAQVSSARDYQRRFGRRGRAGTTLRSDTLG